MLRRRRIWLANSSRSKRPSRSFQNCSEWCAAPTHLFHAVVGWIDYYLRRFTRYGVVQGPYEKDVLFNGPGLCLRSYAAAVTGRPVADVSPQTLPPEWFGNIAHTHRAIDDARGYAHLLGVLFQRARTLQTSAD